MVNFRAKCAAPSSRSNAIWRTPRNVFLQFDTVRDIKEKLCYFPTSNKEAMGEEEYELPDGNTVTLSDECRSMAAEVIRE